MKLTPALLLALSLFASSAFGIEAGTQSFLETVELGEIAPVKASLKKNPSLLNAKNADNQTALSVATENGLDDIALFLMSQGASSEGTFGKDNETLAFLAIRGNSEGTLEKLISKKSKVLTEKNAAGDSLLIAAVRTGTTGIVRLLKKKGLSKTEKNTAGETAESLANSLGYKSIQKILAEK